MNQQIVSPPKTIPTMSTTHEPNPPRDDSNAPKIYVPDATAESNPLKGNLSLKPVDPAASAPASTNPIAATATPKPKLNLAPRTAQPKPAPSASSLKIPDRAYTSENSESDEQPPVVITVITCLAAVATITFAVLLFLKTT